MSPLEVTQFMRVCTDYVLSYASSRAIDFQLTLDGAPLKPTTHLESPVVISADLDSLEKVVFNYLSNALKYTSEQGQIELGVEYRGPKRFESSSGIMVRGSLKKLKRSSSQLFPKLRNRPRELLRVPALGTGVGQTAGRGDEWKRRRRVNAGRRLGFLRRI